MPSQALRNKCLVLGYDPGRRVMDLRFFQ